MNEKKYFCRASNCKINSTNKAVIKHIYKLKTKVHRVSPDEYPMPTIVHEPKYLLLLRKLNSLNCFIKSHEFVWKMSTRSSESGEKKVLKQSI